MSRRRLLFVPCLSAALAAGVFVSPARAEAPLDVTVQDFKVLPIEVNTPFFFFPLGLHFEAQNGTVTLLQPESAGANYTTTSTVIVPSGGCITYVFQKNDAHSWSQPVGETTTFGFQVSPQEIRIRAGKNKTILSLHCDLPVANQAHFLPRALTLTSEEGSLKITRRRQSSFQEADTVIGSGQIPVLKLEYTSDQNMTAFQQSVFQRLNHSGAYLPQVQAPAVPGRYDLTYRDAQGVLLRETLVSVWKTEHSDAANSLHQPYEVDEFDIDAPGSPTHGRRTYFVGASDQPENTAPPENLPPPIRHPSPPTSFRLIHDVAPVKQ